MLDHAYNVIKSFERRLRRKLKQKTVGLPVDFGDAYKPIHDACSPFTMTGPLRMHAMHEAVKYIIGSEIEGDIVECGVWRGGSMMVAAMTLLAAGCTSRDLWLYDTYDGMSEPGENDVTVDGRPARDRWKREQQAGGSDWCLALIEDVRQNMSGSGYPAQRLHFVEGKVQDTIPGTIPGKIALLRLDTDWYESTYHELVHLYPLLSVGGILILDDYGAWKGAREATDTYFQQRGIMPYLGRIDEAARVIVKIA